MTKKELGPNGTCDALAYRRRCVRVCVTGLNPGCRVLLLLLNRTLITKMRSATEVAACAQSDIDYPRNRTFADLLFVLNKAVWQFNKKKTRNKGT